MEDDQEPVEHTPSCTSRLVRDGAVSKAKSKRIVESMPGVNTRDVLKINRLIIRRVATGYEGINCLDIIGECDDITREYKKERENAEEADSVQADKDVWNQAVSI